MTYGYEEALARRAAAANPTLSGGSGYFAERSKTLDPSLFEYGDHLKDEVRATVLSYFYNWANEVGFRGMHRCTTLWLAGSGITTAWDADREAGDEPGDLDCLIGIEYTLFTEMNPVYRGSSNDDIASELNRMMHGSLWPKTARTQIGSSVYELTYYVNPGVGAGPNDLLAINPYAAYNVNEDTWTLHPVQVPEGFSADYFSAHDRQVVAEDLAAAQHLLNVFQIVRQRQQQHPHDVATLRDLHDVVRHGAAAFDAIHDGRKAAFRPGGKGYFDPANFRWQAAKGNGAITVLRALKQLDEQAHADTGAPCGDVGHLLLTAAIANGGVKYR